MVKFGRLIFSRDEAARIDFEVLAQKRYFDFKPVLDYYRRGNPEVEINLVKKEWSFKFPLDT